MSDVTVRKEKQVQHVAGCAKRRMCGCPFTEGGSWFYDIRFTWPSGKTFRERKKVPVSGITERKALAWATERRNAVLAAGERSFAAPVVEAKVPTVAEFKEEYLRHKKAQRLKASTEEQREGVLENWIVPVLGRYRLDQIDLGAVDLLKEAMEEKSRKYTNTVLAILSNMLGAAVDLKKIRERPIRKVGLFKTDNSKAPAFYAEEEYGRLIEAAIKIDARLAVVVLLGGDAGLRSGEIRGLAPYDLKWAERHLHVERQVWKDILDTPKSGRGRVIPMTGRLEWAIRKLGRVKGDTLLLDDDGARFSTKRMRSLVKRAQRDAGLEATGNVHILRHTFCTRLAMRSTPPTVIQQLAGHAHLTTTMRYMHVVTGAKEAAVAALDAALPTGVAPQEAAAEPAGFGSRLAAVP